LKAQQPCEDRTLLLTAILADAINLGVTKMAEACPGTIARKLDWLASLLQRPSCRRIRRHIPMEKTA
jgi:hypothetical protein